MPTYPGIYRAKAVKVSATEVTAFIPQVFGNTSVVITEFFGEPTPGIGWVFFQAGDSSYPVWYVNTESIQQAITQVVADAPYVNVEGDDMTGLLTILQTATGPNIVTNKTGASNVDGAIHVSIRSAGTEIGRITRTTSSTAGFLTTSDEDLKEDITPVDDYSSMLWMRTIEPLFFNYKNKPEVRHVGYCAQRLAAQWPNGVVSGVITPGHGNVNDRTFDADGNETTSPEVWQAWMMDHSKITPILHSCLRTLDTIIEYRGGILADHEQRIAALETTVAAQANQIATLLAQVTTMAGQIAANTTAIATNAQNIATNTNQIAINDSASTTNTNLVAQLRSDMYYTRRTMTYWQYANQATGPAASGQMRTSSPTLNTMWLHRIDDGGYDRDNFLRTIVERTTMDISSVRFRVSGATGSMFELRSTAAAIYDGTVCTIPVAVIAGTSGAKGFRAEVTILTQIWAQTTPPTGPTLHDTGGPL